MKAATALVVLLAVLSPGLAWSFQSHPASEGLYVHQLAHVFFMVAMGILAVLAPGEQICPAERMAPHPDIVHPLYSLEYHGNCGPLG